MTTVHPAAPSPPAGALVVFGGGVAALVATLMPWTSVLTVQVTGGQTAQGKVVTFAALMAIASGYLLSRGRHRQRLGIAMAFAAGIAIAASAGMVASTHEEIVERRLDGQLAEHGLDATDLLGSESAPSLLDQWRPLLRGPAAGIATAIDSATTPRTGVGLWLAIATGVAIAGAALIPSRNTQTGPPTGPSPQETSMSTTTTTNYTVTGMTCGGCVRRVRKAIGDVEGVTDVDVQLTGGVVTITSDAPVDDDAVRAAVDGVGYVITKA